MLSIISYHVTTHSCNKTVQFRKKENFNCVMISYHESFYENIDIYGGDQGKIKKSYGVNRLLV